MLQLIFPTEEACQKHKATMTGWVKKPSNFKWYSITLASSTFKTQWGPMQAQGARNKHATKPPPAIRHQRAVMSLHKSVPPYDVRSHTLSSLQDILQSSRNAEKVMMVTTVSTNRVFQVKEDPKYLELWISFYPRDTWDGENQPPKLDVKVIMPQGWTQDVSFYPQQIY
jgi:hypothetical protein